MEITKSRQDIHANCHLHRKQILRCEEGLYLEVAKRRSHLVGDCLCKSPNNYYSHLSNSFSSRFGSRKSLLQLIFAIEISDMRKQRFCAARWECISWCY